jgi:hypothetical protein
LAVAAGLALAVMFINYTAKDKEMPSYKERLCLYLQMYFDEINASIFRRRGLIWKIGRDAKWIELHIIKIGGGETNKNKNGGGFGGISIAPLVVERFPSPPKKAEASGLEQDDPYFNEEVKIQEPESERKLLPGEKPQI